MIRKQEQDKYIYDVYEVVNDEYNMIEITKDYDSALDYLKNGYQVATLYVNDKGKLGISSCTLQYMILREELLKNNNNETETSTEKSNKES